MYDIQLFQKNRIYIIRLLLNLPREIATINFGAWFSNSFSFSVDMLILKSNKNLFALHMLFCNFLFFFHLTIYPWEIIPCQCTYVYFILCNTYLVFLFFKRESIFLRFPYSHSSIYSFFKNIYFCLEDNCFTMLSWFLLYNNMSQL